MLAILGQTFAALMGVLVAALLFVDTELNLWPVYAAAAFAGAFAWTWFWAVVRGGRGVIVRPSCPEAGRLRGR